jgi:hypothetical protein
MRTWLRHRWRRLRRQRAARRERDAPLREFAYLDEVSVYSLIASRLGAVATEFTAIESSSLRGEAGSSLALSAGILHGGVGSRSESTQSTGSQVVRKSVVQSTFKELVEIEKDAMPLRTPAPDARPPRVDRLDDLLALSESEGAGGWVVDTDALKRGQLVEIEVELQAEDIFRVSAILSAALEIFGETPELAAMAERQGLMQAIAANKVLNQLLVGLVPVRGRAVHYVHVTLDEREFIVHRRLLERLSANTDPSIRPLDLVGVAEQRLFWRDIRRVLFSQARYVVLGRVGRDGVSDKWTPVKLVDVLRDVAPELARQIDGAGEILLSAMRSNAAPAAHPPPQSQRMHESLVRYAAALAEHHGKSATEQELAALGLPTQAQCEAADTLESRRAAFDELTQQLEGTLELPPDRLLAAQLRSSALSESGLDLDQAIDSSPSEHPVPERGDRGSFLDVEIVAVYW